MNKLEKQINGLILKFLNQVYPDGLSLKFIMALLYDWRIFTTETQIKKKNINYLIEQGYIEIKDIQIPIVIDKVEKIRITEKGKALLEGEFIDEKVEFP